jgi:hypothetical protein
MGIPTVAQLERDPFPEQVRHAEFLVNVLLVEDAGRCTDVAMRRLRAQLSHPAGIRGFMVTFLTTTTAASASTIREDDNDSDDESIPKAVVQAIVEELGKLDSDTNGSKSNSSNNNGNDLVSLMCTNVVLPAAMITMHADDPELAGQSRGTAKRATRLLQHVLRLALQRQQKQRRDNSNSNSDSTTRAIRQQCDAILLAAASAVANTSSSSFTANDNSNTTTTTATATTTATEEDETTTEADEDRIRYWTVFLDQWGYGALERDNIAKAIREVLSVVVV